jgi:hypothetical protein
MVPIVEVLNWHARKHALQNAAAAATITLSKKPVTVLRSPSPTRCAVLIPQEGNARDRHLIIIALWHSERHQPRRIDWLRSAKINR